MNKWFSCVVVVLIALFNTGNAQQLAFPGAEGFGRFATGGRGGIVYYVTDTTDNPSKPTVGSLRYGITKLTGARTILFKVSGTISLQADLKIANGNITIAGQSAPGDGICLKNFTLRLNTSNIIVRYIRCRLGDLTSYIDDAMDANGNSPVPTDENIIVDHCSLSWSIDETGSFYDIKKFTLQWCILSESFYKSVDPKGDHGYAGIWGGQGASFHHNLLAHHTSRNPRFCGSRYTGDSLKEVVDFRNNVLYNWGNINTVYGGEGGNYNIINNYYKPGPATPGSFTSSNKNLRNRILSYTSYYCTKDSYIYPDTLWGGKYFVDGNFVKGYPDVSADNWTKGVQSDGFYKAASLMARNKLTAPIAVAPINTQTAEDAYLSVLNNVGAYLPKRDTVDRRILRETRDGTATFEGPGYSTVKSTNVTHPSGIIDGQANVGGWPVLLGATPSADVDNDGMADEWEMQRGLNSTNAADRNNVSTNGYTNLENFLNGDSIVAFGKSNTFLPATDMLLQSTNQWLNAKDTTYTRLISTDTMNLVASVYDSGVTNQLKVYYYTTSGSRLYNLQPYLRRNISIIPTNGITSLAQPIKIRLFFTANEFNALKNSATNVNSINDLQVYLVADSNLITNFSGTTVAPIVLDGASLFGTYNNGYYVEFTTAKLGTFFIAGKSLLLPVSLVNFTGSANKQDIVLSWTTQNEINMSGYEVEKSEDGINYTVIGTVNSENKKGEGLYFFNDKSFKAGKFYYRLKLINKDGTYRHSLVVVVAIDDNKNGITVSPNPFRFSLVINYSLSTDDAQVKVYSPDGKLVYNAVLPNNTTQSKLPLSTLKAGTYFLIYANKSTSFTAKVIKE